MPILRAGEEAGLAASPMVQEQHLERPRENKQSIFPNARWEKKIDKQLKVFFFSL